MSRKVFTIIIVLAFVASACATPTTAPPRNSSAPQLPNDTPIPQQPNNAPVPQSLSNPSAPQLPSDTPIPQLLPSNTPNTPIQQLPTNTPVPVISANRNPNVPSLVSPATNTGMAFGSAPRLCGQHNGDPDGDSITSYQFIVNGAKSWDSGLVSNNCVDMPTSATNSAGTYYWLVRVYDARGGFTASGTWYFVIRANVPTTAAPAANRNPNVPSLSSPQTNTGITLGNAPRLCGQHNGDPDGDAITSYQFVVNGPKSWDSGVVSSNCVNVPTSAVNSKGTYYWLIRVRDSRGGVNSSSTSWYFVVR